MMRPIAVDAKRLLALACVLALAACHKDKAGDQRTATGQVIAGTISDSMIPYESLKSKPPLAPRETGGGGKSAANDSVDSADSQGASADVAPPGGAAAPAAAGTAAGSAAPIRY
jgi:hypothetical protein